MSFQAALGIGACALLLSFYWARRKGKILYLTLGAWIALCFLLLPLYKEQGAPGFPEHLMLTVMRSLKIVAGGGEYYGGAESIRALGTLGRAYSILLTLIYMLAPMVSAVLILTVIHDVSAWVGWMFSRGEETWFFSAPTPKAVMLARDALKDPRHARLRVVFCGVGSSQFKEISRIGVAFSQEAVQLPKRYFSRCFSSVFFISDDEDRNLRDTLDFLDRHRDAARPLTLYPFTCKPEAPLLIERKLDQHPNPHLRCRRIAENRALAYREAALMHGDLIKTASTEGKAGKRSVHVMLVGCGWRGMEILKALLWCCADAQTALCIDIVDQGQIRDRLRRAFPSLGESGDLDGYSYRLRLTECTDIRAFSPDGLEEADFGPLQCIFIALGNDAKNMEMALQLRQTLERSRLEKNDRRAAAGPARPPIRIAMSHGGQTDFGEAYNILPFAQDAQFYSVDTLLNPQLEYEALLLHARYLLAQAEPGPGRDRLAAIEKELMQTAPENGRWTVADYRKTQLCAFRHADALGDFYREYGGNSTRARALYRLCRRQAGLPVSPGGEEGGAREQARLKQEEHCRWRMYMLTEGWSPGYETAGDGPDAKRQKSPVARLHPDLAPFSALDEKERRKD